MVAILGGLGAAMSWAIATLASSRSSRMIGPLSVLGWVMAIGLAVAIVPALLAKPVPLGTGEIAMLVATGLSHNVGLLLAYGALSIGRVSVVAPITSTEGAIAAVFAVLLGEQLAADDRAAADPDRGRRGPRRHRTRSPTGPKASTHGRPARRRSWLSRPR